MARVAINIVTWNSSDYIQVCLDAALAQTHPDIKITVLDNGSTDSTLSCLAPYLEMGIRLIRNPSNTGYAAAHNQLIQATESDYVLTLNPDVRLIPTFVEHLVNALEKSPQYGAASGQLRAVSRQQFLEGEPGANEPLRIDEAGMGILRSRRQYARGYQHLSEDRYAQPTAIFGPCGAAAFYRRTMLEDIAVNQEYFDASFFVHKEDVDIAWRAQLLGWPSYYVPSAVGYHVRTFHPGQRKGISVEIRRHAIKNRWLMAVKNETLQTFLLDLPYILTYEMQIIAYLLLFEHDSLPAFIDFFKLLPRAVQWRKIIQPRARIPAREMRRWFRTQPE